MIRYFFLAFCLWTLGIAPAAAQLAADFATIPRFRVQEGDDLRWADPAFDDRGWPEKALGEVEPGPGIFWLRGRIHLTPEHFAETRPLAARFLALASCQMYWNGEWLGDNGTVAASSRSEKPGDLDWLQPLPPSIKPGAQSVALRCSAHRRGFKPHIGFYVFWVGDALRLAELGRDYAAWTLLSAGGLGAMGLFYVMVFVFGRRSRSHLWLGLFACGAGALVIIESLRPLVGYSYDLHFWRLLIIAALTLTINLLLVTFVTSRFPLLHWKAFRVVTFGLLIAGLAAPGFDAKSACLFLVGLIAGLVWTLRAWLHGRSDAAYSIAGLVLCLMVGIWQQRAFLDFYLFFTLTVLGLFLLLSHVVADGRERREHAATEMRSARLEIELLKRHLQPHFLMNTLTALSEWFEQSPEVATEMIQQLGQELRILADVSSRSSIPIGQELKLCRSHLAVMARRRDEQLALDTDGVDLDSSVPPAIFHTLLENALSHNSYRDQGARFRLRQVSVGAKSRFTFDAPLRPRPRAGAAATPSPAGTGLRYIRARLRESYGDDFSLTDDAITANSGEPLWRTVIEIPRQSRAEAH